jgi:HSP20 family protein
MAHKETSPQKRTSKAVAESRELMNPFVSFRREMDRLMDDFFSGFDLRPPSARSDIFVPHVDVVDTDKEIKVSAELPGMDEKDIEVALSADTLTIKGEKKEEKEEKGKDYYRSERSYGSFMRTVPLPLTIETDKVSASFAKGVLTVTLPKTKQTLSGTKKVDVKTE